MEREWRGKEAKGLIPRGEMCSHRRNQSNALDAKQKGKYWISVAFAQRFMMCLVKKSLKRMMASENQTNIVSVLTYTTHTNTRASTYTKRKMWTNPVKNRIDIGNYNKPWIMCFAAIHVVSLPKCMSFSGSYSTFCPKYDPTYFGCCASSKSFSLFRCNVYL